MTQSVVPAGRSPVIVSGNNSDEPISHRGRHAILGIIGAMILVCIIAIIMIAVTHKKPVPPPAPVYNFEITAAKNSIIANVPGTTIDGRNVAGVQLAAANDLPLCASHNHAKPIKVDIVTALAYARQSDVWSVTSPVFVHDLVVNNVLIPAAGTPPAAKRHC